VTAIERYQYLQGLWLDHIAWAERALNSSNAASAPEIRLSRAKLLNNLGLVHGGFGEFATALEHLGEARLIQEELDDAGGLATTLNNIGFVHSKEGRYHESLRNYQRALPLRSKADDRGGYGTTLNNMGVIYSKIGEYSEALRCYEEAVGVREEVGDRVGLATSLSNIGLVYGKQKRWDLAIRFIRRHCQSGRRLVIGLAMEVPFIILALRMPDSTNLTVLFHATRRHATFSRNLVTASGY
jgi:tetratricopeptide (TPR) repeat protein